MDKQQCEFETLDTEVKIDEWYKMRVALKEYHRQFSMEHHENMNSFNNFNIYFALRNFKQPNWNQFLIVMNNVTVGILETCEKESDFDTTLVLYVSLIFIKDEYRKKGIAHQVFQILKEKHRLPLELHCEYDNVAHKAYEQTGFKRIETLYRNEY